MVFPAVFELSSLNGNNGFTINGINRDDISGRSVSNAGDINGDGFDDLIIGAPGADTGLLYDYFDPADSYKPNNAGQGYVVFGKSGNFSANLELSDLDGRNGFTFSGSTGSRSGSSVSSVGDINGDGFDDLIIGAPSVKRGGHYTSDTFGQSYIVFGNSTGFSSTVNFSNGVTIISGDSFDRSGFSVSGLGDINGDGFDDLIIGTSFNASSYYFGSGYGYSLQAPPPQKSYVVFGTTSGFSSRLQLSSLTPSNGFRIIDNNNNLYDRLGFSVSGAGDINGDGINDLIISDPDGDANGIDSGKSYVVFGNSNGFSFTLDLSTLDGSNGFTINGINAGDRLGISVSNAGDFNGDGIDDLIIGASNANSNSKSDAGKSYVIFGNSNGFSSTLDLSTLDGSNGFTINGINAGDGFGTGVSSAGDFNSDGFDDLIVSAPGADLNGNLNAGRSYVIFGKSNGFNSTLDLSTLDGSNGFTINGINAGDGFGTGVSSAGDFNSDGFDDLIVSAPGADPNGKLDAGQSYVIFGRSTKPIVGTSSDDTLQGSSAEDTLLGLNGNDRIYGGDGNDSLFGLAGDDSLDGGLREDSIVGAIGNDSIDGGDENDTLRGGDGNDTIDGGDGNDSINGGLGSDAIEGGIGNDTLSIFFRRDNSSTGITTNISSNGNDGYNGSYSTSNETNNFSNIENFFILGTSNNDSIVTGDGNDTLIGFTGDDSLDGSGGRDTIDGGAGNDTINGGDGNDTINGRLGRDIINGGAGEDTINGGGSGDIIDGGLGNDIIRGNGIINGGLGNDIISGVFSATIDGGDGDDTIFGTRGRGRYNIRGGDGNDIIRGKKQSDLIDGGFGNDTINGDNGNDSIDGGDGNDSIHGGRRNDTIDGGDGNDTINGEGGNDRINGGDGNDTIDGGSGSDSINGGDGNDSIDGEGGNDRINGGSGHDSIDGGIGNDTLSGGRENDTLMGRQQPDFLRGNGGNDHLIGGSGNDSLFGDGGNDLLVGNQNGDYLNGGFESDTLIGGPGNDTLDGELGNDSLLGTDGNDFLNGGFGHDRILGDNGHDVLDGESGNDVLLAGNGNDMLMGRKGIDNLNGGNGNDTLFGGNDHDTLLGLAQADRLLGNDGRDFIKGGSGNDNLFGGNGRDTLIGGNGIDTITGGAGSDSFGFNSYNEGIDNITDFSPVADSFLIFRRGFKPGLSLGILNQGQFTLGASAKDFNDRFIYDPSTGDLFFDLDGIGSFQQRQIANLNPSLALSRADFIIV